MGIDKKKEPRILLVDDEKKFTEVVADILRRQGFSVDVENSGDDALKTMISNSFQLLIVDLKMPGMDGLELIRRVRQALPDQRIIVVTGFPSHQSQEEAHKLGAINYIVKPFSLKRFLEVVEKALSNNQKKLLGPVELHFSELVQVYALEGIDVVLEIRHGKDTGRIYFEKGRIIHAETNSNKGEQAFYEILAWRSGTFKPESYKEAITPTISSSVTSLLVEGARMEDERLSNGSLDNERKQVSPEEENLIRAYFRSLHKYDKEVMMAFENMKDIDILRHVVEETDGAIAAGLVSMDGISMGVYTTVEGFDTKAADAEFASMLRAGQKASTNLGPAFGDVEELILSGANGIVIVRTIGDKYYSGIALTKDGNIGKARMLQQKLVKEMYRRYYGE